MGYSLHVQTCEADRTILLLNGSIDAVRWSLRGFKHAVSCHADIHTRQALIKHCSSWPLGISSLSALEHFTTHVWLCHDHMNDMIIFHLPSTAAVLEYEEACALCIARLLIAAASWWTLKAPLLLGRPEEIQWFFGLGGIRLISVILLSAARQGSDELCHVHCTSSVGIPKRIPILKLSNHLRKSKLAVTLCSVVPLLCISPSCVQMSWRLQAKVANDVHCASILDWYAKENLWNQKSWRCTIAKGDSDNFLNKQISIEVGHWETCGNTVLTLAAR